MYVLAINGSPRKGGNTENLLNQVLTPLQESGWETEMVQIGGKVMRGCMACNKCWKTQNNQCGLPSDPFNDLMAKMLKADALVLGSPTYFTDVTAEMKALLDRAGMVALANDRAFAGKIGAAVVAVRRGGGIHVYDTINHMFLMSQMIVPGATYWNLGFGLAKGDVEQDDEGAANMLCLGQTIDWLGRVMKPHQESFPKAEGNHG